MGKLGLEKMQNNEYIFGKKHVKIAHGRNFAPKLFHEGGCPIEEASEHCTLCFVSIKVIFCSCYLLLMWHISILANISSIKHITIGIRELSQASTL